MVAVGAKPSADHNSRIWLQAWIILLLLTLALWWFAEYWPWMLKYPRAWVWPLKDLVSNFMSWLINDFDLGLFTFKELTRSIALVMSWPLEFAKGLLSQGFKIPLGGDDFYQTPSLPWISVTLFVVFIAWRLKNFALAVLMFFCFIYLAVFGQWQSAMLTLSSIIVAVPIGVAGGLFLGIWAYRSSRVEIALTPILDLMQTVPVFAYLVPILFLFGFGPVAAMIATIIYAMPPMVRVTILALQNVPAEIKEFGRMTGCTQRQLTWKILIPAARSSLLVGVNQVIMLSLNMVIIASMIGAGGLGYDVLASLRRLAIGQGLEAGLAITLLAVALDRLSQAAAQKNPGKQEAAENSVADVALWRRYPMTLLAMTVIILLPLLAVILPWISEYPESWQITTGPFWNNLVKWININYFDQLEAVKVFMLLNILIPVKRFLLALPWPAVLAMLALAGYQLGGWRLALLVFSLALFIVLNGLWPKAMVTVYLCGISVIIASIIGMPIGMWAARNERVSAVIKVLIDTLQTLPSFVYLMPVVMLFRVGDFAAMIAVVLYALPPAIRYTEHGIRKVPADLLEAAKTSGCTPGQTLFKVQIPVALPEIMLGVNQTVMFAISMLVITALVGTRDLGQEVYIALVKADTGRGIVAGISVAFIAIIVDRLIAAWAKKRKQKLGLMA